MSTVPRDRPAASLWVRVIRLLRRPPVAVGLGLALILAPMLAAYLDGVFGDLVGQGTWRLVMSPAAVVLYILAVSPIVQRAEADVLDAFRPLVLIDDDRFERLIVDASRLSPLGEGLAASLGAVSGLWLGWLWLSDSDVFWLRLVLVPSAGLMFGLLAWTIYAAVSGTRLIAELHAQPLRIDILDTRPFRPVGRQSLIVALVFVGGIVLGMLFSLGEESVLDWRNWLIYSLLALVPILVFFLNMRPTHRVLAAEKRRELAAVQDQILRATRTLMARTTAGESTVPLGADINALVAYEKRLLAASTWPYDTAMLRTLFFSVILPAIAALARIVARLVID
jgi:hypothetical protein